MIGSWQRRVEGVGVLRARLIGSILVAALLPLAMAWWIANAYVEDQARADDAARLTFAARSASREAATILGRTRTRALALAESPALQRAARSHDRAALARLLGPREAVQLPGSGGWVGQHPGGVPASRIVVTSGDRRLATVSVFPPAATALLARVTRGAIPVSGSSIALLRGTAVVAGPAALHGAVLRRDGRLHVNGTSYSTRTVSLPGYDPPARLVVAAKASVVAAELSALQRRLELAALVSLIAIALFAAALSRPLLRSLNRVAYVAEQAMIDPLTGVANRRGFERSLEIELERSLRRGHPCALVIVDLDDFKQVNDRYGHAVGDDVLLTLSERLRDSVRSADTVSRLGGEEFALLLPETDLAGALAVAERARSAFAAGGVQLKNGGSLTVTASFGAADFPASPDRGALLRDADQALYAAKRLGKDRVVPVTRAVEAA